MRRSNARSTKATKNTSEVQRSQCRIAVVRHTPGAYPVSYTHLPNKLKVTINTPINVYQYLAYLPIKGLRRCDVTQAVMQKPGQILHCVKSRVYTAVGKIDRN